MALPRVILHVDMDAFFAAVEQRDNPKLIGLPVVVGADPQQGKGRGVVSTCSYEARRYGIHSAMPISQAYRLCPQAVFLPGDSRRYRRASEEILAILEEFTPDIEPISIDEAFLDITGSYHFYGTPQKTAAAIKERIKKEVRLTASIGIAPSKMVAKIASDVSKPDGLCEVLPEKLFDFLWPLPVERLWGVGPKSKEAFYKMGIKTIGDLARIPEDTLAERFGENGRHLFELSHGIDDREVAVDEKVKSVSHEHTFDTDTGDANEVRKIMLSLSEKVSRRLRKYGLKGKTLTVKIRLKGFATYTRAFTLPERTNFTDDIYKKSKELFEAFYKKGMQVRLIGVRVSNFEEPYIGESLFTDKSAEKKEDIHRAVDRIKDKFGEGAIHRAA